MLKESLRRADLFKWLSALIGGWLLWRFVRRQSRSLHISRRQTAVFNQIACAITDEMPLDTVLGQILTAIAEQLQSTWVTLFFYEPQQDTLRERLVYQDGQIKTAAEDDLMLAQPFPARDIPLWQEMQSARRPIVVADVTHDPRLKYRELLLTLKIQSLLVVPLILGSEVIGWFSLNCPQRRHYRAEELELAQALARQATIAVQLTRLAERSRQMAVLEERNRLAHEIHDTLAQGFTGIVVQLEAAEEVLSADAALAQPHLDRARRLARESLAEARRSVRALRPQALEQGSLSQALAHLVELMTGVTAVQTEFRLQGQPRPLAPDVEDNLLRIGQEALTNAFKHAQASHIQVELAFEPEQVCLSVEDNGLGFNPAALIDHGFGLAGLRWRAAQIGGQLTVESQPGIGTNIVCQVKLEP
jgi:signal transduction histidine kinase